VQHVTKQDVQKQSKWRRRPRRFGTKQRPLPTENAEFGQFMSVKVRRDLPRGLSLLEALRVPISPAGHDFFEPRPKDFVLVGHFLAQIPDQTPVTALLGLQPLEERLKVAPQSRERPFGTICKTAIQVRRPTFGEPVDYLESEVLLTLKVVVKGPLRYASRLQDRFNSGVVISSLQKNPLTRVE
jgi:hypothetical protein